MYKYSQLMNTHNLPISINWIMLLNTKQQYKIIIKHLGFELSNFKPQYSINNVLNNYYLTDSDAMT